MKKYLIILISFFSIIFFIDNVNAETVTYSYVNPFEESTGHTNKIISSVVGDATINNDALYLNGSDYIKYTLNSELIIQSITFEFDFFKSNTASYPRLVYLGGMNREIEVKGASNSMYINGEVSTGWVQNEWNHMKIECGNGYITYYVNGTQVKQESYTTPITFIQFGKGSQDNNFFTGYVDNLSIYVEAEKITDNIIVFNNSKGLLKIDPTNKIVYVKNISDSDYTQLFKYTKDYIVVQLSGDFLTFVESDIDTIFASVKASYHGEGFQAFTDANGNIGKNEFFHTFQYYLTSKRLERDVPFGVYTDDINKIIKSNANIYSLSDGSLLFKKNYVTDTTPKITITKENETTVTIDDEIFISSVTLNIEFSNVENDKYFYLYKYGLDSDWSTITLTNSNSFTKTFNTNDTLYVQISDKITQETVSNATFTINQINYNFEPYVDITETIPTACTFHKNGRTYTICKELNISAKNLEDGNYISSYSYNATDWTNFVNTTIPVNDNTTIYFQIVNYLTNEVSYRSVYTVANIDTDISELGVFNTYSSTYDKDTSFITAYINIYNLVEPVQDNYKIYYSFDSTSFVDITLLLTDMTNYYQYEINNINEDKTIYFKITDLNNNILYISTYNINYQKQANENSNFFTNFRTNFHGLSDIISIPLYAIKKLNTAVCTPLEIPIPYTGKNISLPCMTTVYQNNIPIILNIWQIVTNGIISYYIILDLFKIIKSFKEPEEDKIEVVNL